MGPGRFVWRLGDALSVRVDARAAVVTTVLVLAALATGVVALGLGDYTVPVPDVLGALAGTLDGPARTVVVGWRLPRVLLALLLGAALAVSGAIFQSLTRNPLGSPDVIGFASGSYTGGLVAIIVLGGGYTTVAAGSLAGGLATAAAVYLLAYRRGVQGFRLIVVGIGVTALLGSLNTWLVLAAELQQAMAASAWGAGSLNGVGWPQVGPTVGVLVVLVVALGLLGRRASVLEMGDDAAHALGLAPERTRAALVVVGVAFTAVATAVAGPISFVALAAPQLARRLTRAGGTGLASAAAMGALLLVVSDVLAQRAFAPTQLPVGVVTVSIGGAYLVWLLVREARRQ
ncbi:iron-enterobactin ABC transporter permease [Cellulomonas triticagri]|uniref:Iron-enterobactin ABC transporter permease n=1 Tax=Cellulomonas triticagri TaxID=2483352 RepID=A0A3M2IYJ8_9CELL|nr:iron-enterobactin ABC transporter permease [Cellulomonas triticagri]